MSRIPLRHVDLRPLEQDASDLVSRALSHCVGAIRIIGSLRQTIQLTQSARVIGEDQGRDGLLALIGFADVDGAPKKLFRFERSSTLVESKRPVVEQNGRRAGLIATD